MTDVTHLIADTHGSDKYKVCPMFSIPMVQVCMHPNALNSFPTTPRLLPIHIYAFGQSLTVNFQCAVRHNVPIMLSTWITECYEVWLRGDDVDLQEVRLRLVKQAQS